MSKYKQIQTKYNYNKLLNSGMFYEFYPELSGKWATDDLIITKWEMNNVLVISEEDLSDGDNTIIGVATNKEQAISMIEEYYNKDCILERNVTDVRDSGIEFYMSLVVDLKELPVYETKITVFSFNLNQL